MNKWILAALGLLLSHVAIAKELTETELQNWIQSWPEMEAWFVSKENQISQSEQIDMRSSTPEQVAKVAKSALATSGLTSEFSGLAKKYGFEQDRYFEVQTRVMQAFMGIATQGIPNDTQNALADAMRQLKESPDLTPEQKELMMEQFKSMAQTTAQLKEQRQAPTADQALVKKYQAQLKQVFGDQ